MIGVCRIVSREFMKLLGEIRIVESLPQCCELDRFGRLN